MAGEQDSFGECKYKQTSGFLDKVYLIQQDSSPSLPLLFTLWFRHLKSPWHSNRHDRTTACTLDNYLTPVLQTAGLCIAPSDKRRQISIYTPSAASGLQTRMDPGQSPRPRQNLGFRLKTRIHTSLFLTTLT